MTKHSNRIYLLKYVNVMADDVIFTMTITMKQCFAKSYESQLPEQCKKYKDEECFKACDPVVDWLQ